MPRPEATALPAALTRTFVTVDDPRWRQCHASTVAAPTGGAPLVAWFAGTREGTPDNRIWLSGPAGVHALDTGYDMAHWNPVPAPDPSENGVLWLFAKAGPRISEWVTLVTRTRDGGATWERPRELVPGDLSGGRGPVKNPPLVTPEGLWPAPASVEHWAKPARWDPFVDVSADSGATWSRAPIPVDRAALRGAGHIQPSLWLGPDGPVALMRSTESRAHRAVSRDGGRRWSLAVPTGLPNNNSGLCALALPSGRAACVHNPSSQDWGSRCPLVVSVSDDDGMTWREVAVVDDGLTLVDPAVPQRLDPHARPGFAPGDAGVVTSGVAEFSYPTAVLDGPDLLITYTWQRRGIVLARLSLTHLEES
ncbi:neuraminidase (sialidase) [Streptomyces antnestii]|uniref:Neuraminidase (Sialidase) n=1 Tax=Streptomyces antnestii TaxID=2494256 RepID=A0A3S2VTN8_9ACTN|nr:sialidase family protein [Streptomyces sp. San01]RVU20834.1 neuraminidase (sialidase) [Streptomyces sp. San01]